MRAPAPRAAFTPGESAGGRVLLPVRCSRCLLVLATVTLSLTAAAASGAAAPPAPVVRVASGLLAGRNAQVDNVPLREFRGIPFAQPPLGPLRWQPPQPPRAWAGIRQATRFGDRCMQRPLFGQLATRASGMSENCLTLNVWTPAKNAHAKLPVLVYIYGGAFKVGDGAQPIYDQASLAARGIVTVTFNYRLNVFGFLALPALATESPHHATGNYGLLDQVAALQWVKANIARFGGNPAQITIAGQSSGSVSVSAQLASPLSRHLIARAIGESGAMIAPIAPTPLAEAKEQGLKFMHAAGVTSLADLRKLPAAALQAALGPWPHGSTWFAPDVDGYFLPQPPLAIYQQGQQAHIPLLAGTNSREAPWTAIIKHAKPTVASYRAALQRLFGTTATRALQLYPAASDADVEAAATALATDMFTAHCTWRWLHLQYTTDGAPVYAYRFTGARAPPVSGGGPASSSGAPHGDELAFAYGNLDNIGLAGKRSPAELALSRVMEGYFANFIKTGNPNGSGLPPWPAMKPREGGFARQTIGLKTATGVEHDAARNQFLTHYYDTHPHAPYVGPTSSHHHAAK